MRCHTNQCPTGITTHDKRLQAGLDPDVKAENVKNFVKAMRKDVNIIAHSCGVTHARDLTRRHVRIVQMDGRSINMAELLPDITAAPKGKVVDA